MALKIEALAGTSKGITNELYIIIEAFHIMTNGGATIEVLTYLSQTDYETDKNSFVVIEAIPSIMALPDVRHEDLNGLPSVLEFFEGKLKDKLTPMFGNNILNKNAAI